MADSNTERVAGTDAPSNTGAPAARAVRIVLGTRAELAALLAVLDGRGLLDGCSTAYAYAPGDDRYVVAITTRTPAGENPRGSAGRPAETPAQPSVALVPAPGSPPARTRPRVPLRRVLGAAVRTAGAVAALASLGWLGWLVLRAVLVVVAVVTAAAVWVADHVALLVGVGAVLVAVTGRMICRAALRAVLRRIGRSR